MKMKIAVDGACSGNPGEAEYRGVEMFTGNEIFRRSIGIATNNIAEFLAIVHAIGLSEKSRVPFEIYSDSKTAIKWIQNKQINTRHQPSGDLHKILERAIRFLHRTNFPVEEIRKWDTTTQGEIPADFGRK